MTDFMLKISWKRDFKDKHTPPISIGPFKTLGEVGDWLVADSARLMRIATWAAFPITAPDEVSVCIYETTWTDEAGDIPICKTHGNNSRHDTSENPTALCLTVDPYPKVG